MITLVGNIQVCKNCKLEFGTDETFKCNTCKSYICPNCFKCNCSTVDYRTKQEIGLSYA